MTNWTDQINGWKVLSNQAVGSNASDINYSYWNADAFANDQWSPATIVTMIDGGVSVRANGTGAARNLYYWEGKSGVSTCNLVKVVASAETNLQTGIATGGDGDIFKISVVGSTLQCFQNGVQRGTDQTDAAIASGSAGMACYQNTTPQDTWSGGNNLTVTAPFPPWRPSLNVNVRL